MQIKPLVIIAASLGISLTAKAQNVNLSVTGLKSNKGQLIISVFRNEAEFKDNKPSRQLKVVKAAAVNGALNTSCSLPAGTYGFALVDDENGNGSMDKNMMGIPKEGFGFSNFYLSGMSRPVFSDFRFVIGSQPVKVATKMRYL